MPALKVEILTSVDSGGLQSATTGLRELRGEVAQTAEALQPVAERASEARDALQETAAQAAPAAEAVKQIGESAPAAADGLEDVGSKAEDAGQKLKDAGDSAQWTASQIQAAAPKIDADPLVAYAQSAKQAADALDDDADGLIAFANAATTADQSIKPLAASTKDHGSAASSAGVQTEKLGQIFGGLARASNGGKEGLLGLAMAAKAFWASISGGTVTIIMAVVAALAGLAIGFMGTGKSAEEAKKKIDELNKAKLDSLANEQKLLKTATDEALGAIDKEVAAMDRLADRKLARQVEEVKAAGYSQEVEAKKITALRRQAEDAKLGREQSALDRKAEVQDIAASEAEQKRLNAAAERAALLSAKAAREEASKRFANAEASYQGAIGTGASIEEVTRASNERENARRSLRSANSVYEGKIGGADSDGSLFAKKLETLDAAYKSTVEAAQNAAKAAESAQAAASAEREAQKNLAPETKGLRAAEDKIAAGENKVDAATVAKYRQLGKDAVSTRFARGDSTVDEAAMREAFPELKVDGLRRNDAASAASKPSGGTMIGPDGQVINTTAARQPAGPSMIGPDGRPVAVQPGGQPTGPGRGAYREESAIAKPLQDAAKAMESAPTGDDTAKAAEALKDATEQQVSAQQAASEQTVAALTDMLGMSQDIVGTLQPIPGQISNMRAEIQKLWGAVRSARSKSNAA